MREIFVFGSNTAGRHGKGAALAARRDHGAIYGKAEGLQGNSYAIPTKDAALKTLPLQFIAPAVRRFLEFARNNPNWRFRLTPIGCGLAGYQPDDIAPMFRDAPSNVALPDEFRLVLEAKEDAPAREDTGGRKISLGPFQGCTIVDIRNYGEKPARVSDVLQALQEQFGAKFEEGADGER